MTIDHTAELIRSSIWLAIQLAGPMLAVCFVIGLLISVFQAATQLQDQTVNFVPKLAAAAIAVVALLPWMLERLSEFSRSLIESVPGLLQ